MEGPVDADVYHSEAVTAVLHCLLNSDSARAESRRRQNIVEWIDGLSIKHLGVRAFPVGAFLSNTSQLISSDQVELTLFYDKDDNSRSDRWYLTLYEALCDHSVQDRDRQDAWKLPIPTVVESISYFPREQKLEAVADGILVSIKPNDVCSLAFASLLDDFDKAVGGESLLKRSILLIKAWCINEAPLLRPNEERTDLTGAFNSCLNLLRCDKVIEVMVMALCSSNMLIDASSDPVQEPFKVLWRFLDIFSRFDWINYAVGVTGLIPLPFTGLQIEPKDEDVGTETDSPSYSTAPSPLSSTSCESEANSYPVVGNSNLSANLSTIVNKYRVRLSLASLSEDNDEGPHRLHSVDTDVEDNSCCDERENQRSVQGTRIRLTAGFSRMQTAMERIRPGDSKDAHILLSESDQKLASLARTGVIVLDPTKGCTNLCTSNPTAMTPESRYLQQEHLKRMFASGLSTIRQSMDATDVTLRVSCTGEPSNIDGVSETRSTAAHVVKIIKSIFPGMSQMTVLKESFLEIMSGVGINGSILPSLVQNDSVHLSSTLRYAENAICSKICTATAASNMSGGGASHPRCRGSIYDSETTISSTTQLSTQPKQTEIIEALTLSEISISKSFSSFESDIGLGNDYSINLGGEPGADAAIRFLSVYSPPELTPSASHDGYVSKQQNATLMNQSDYTGSESFFPRDPTQLFSQQGSRILSTGSLDYSKQPIVTGEMYHQHQKTLMRHSQTAPPPVTQSTQSAARQPATTIPPRVGDVQQEVVSSAPASLPSKLQTPIAVLPNSGKLLSPPFIQPFVVKEMQVWVPGKFGSSNSGPVPAKIPTAAPQVINTKSTAYSKGAYAAMGSGGHAVGNGQGAQAARFSPNLPGTSPRASHNYVYPNSEEDYDVNWIDQPEEGNPRIKANRMALVGHQQMHGQLRDRQRHGNSPGDHFSPAQYTGAGTGSGSSRTMGRSPISDHGSTSPHGHSPPINASSPFTSMQVKRPPGNSGGGQPSSRLNYAISSGMNASSPRSSSTPLVREVSPPGFNMSLSGSGDHIADYDSWSLGSHQHLRQQSLHIPEVSPFPGVNGSSPRSFCLADQHAEQRRSLLLQQQQQLQLQQHMILLGSEKSRGLPSTSQKQKSEAQLPSFLRDL